MTLRTTFVVMQIGVSTFRRATYFPSVSEFKTVASVLVRMLGRSCLLAALLVAAHAQTPAAPAIGSDSPAAKAPPLRSFNDWITACNRLPSNRALKGRLPSRTLLPLTHFGEFDEVLQAFFTLSQNGTLSRATNWIGSAPGTNTFFNTSRAYFLPPTARAGAIPFEPFAQKLSLPADSEVYFRGDLHGDLRSLLANLTWLNEQGYLRGFDIVRSNFHMVFLGDFTDRGAYGVEVLYTLLRLKLANPERVFLTRGNHEEAAMQSRYGFFQEGQGKYGREFNALKIGRASDFFPVVIYVGTGSNFIQCNHGGMEPGFSPRALLEGSGANNFQLIGSLSQQRFLAAHADLFSDAAVRQLARDTFRDFRPEAPTDPDVLGFMWNDFTVQNGEPEFARDPGRAYIYGARATAAILRSASTPTREVRAVFRAHQHSTVPNTMMRRLVASRGVFRHWQAGDAPSLLDAPLGQLRAVLEKDEVRSIPPASVWTFNVGTDSFYGQGNEYDFDAFGLLRLAPEFSDWKLRVVNVPVKF
jgi:hypothetical protein